MRGNSARSTNWKPQRTICSLLEDILFEKSGEEPEKISITKEMVNSKLREIVKDHDLSRYIL